MWTLENVPFLASFSSDINVILTGTVESRIFLKTGLLSVCYLSSGATILRQHWIEILKSSLLSFIDIFPVVPQFQANVEFKSWKVVFFIIYRHLSSEATIPRQRWVQKADISTGYKCVHFHSTSQQRHLQIWSAGQGDKYDSINWIH